MADSVLYIEWGNPARGREKQALAVLRDAQTYFASLQGQGTIESFEMVQLLEPTSDKGCANLLVRGEMDAITKLRANPEMIQLYQRAGLVVTGFRVAQGVVGAGLDRWMADYEKQIEELG
jgi:hypothetical protein